MVSQRATGPAWPASSVVSIGALFLALLKMSFTNFYASAVLSGAILGRLKEDLLTDLQTTVDMSQEKRRNNQLATTSICLAILWRTWWALPLREFCLLETPCSEKLEKSCGSIDMSPLEMSESDLTSSLLNAMKNFFFPFFVKFEYFKTTQQPAAGWPFSFLFAPFPKQKCVHLSVVTLHWRGREAKYICCVFFKLLNCVTKQGNALC